MATIFPLIRLRRTSRSTAGTAFLIAGDGTFATAAHIQECAEDCEIRAAPDPDHLERAVPIRWLFRDNTSDLAVGKIEGDFTGSCLRFAAADPPSGTAVTALGFPHEEPCYFRNGKFNRRSAPLERAKCEVIAFVQDFVTAMPTGPNGVPISPKRFPALLTAPTISIGHSGGPIVDLAGAVLGIHSMLNDDKSSSAKMNGGQPFSISVSYDAVQAAIRRRLPDLVL